jgi:DtxR family transcriptional regulator, Mn-dependent transcriptional regulator
MSDHDLTAEALAFLSAVHLAMVEHGRVTLQNIGEQLEITVSAASRRAARLVRRGYLRRDGDYMLTLSQAGQREALRAIRRLEICEAYLVSVMGYSWEAVFPIAWRLVGNIDDDLVERMYIKAGRPQRCPHGQPIPTADGRLPVLADQSLTSLEAGAAGRISRVVTHDPELLRYLASVRLQPGTSIVMKGRVPFGEHLRLSVAHNGAAVDEVIGTKAAACVYVDPQH